ncbi:MAG TPA: POTRA domain-containing protein, partial [Limnochordia bacterium]|nr:POTRA domain-containing protein [Limnochordia bacterium]
MGRRGPLHTHPSRRRIIDPVAFAAALVRVVALLAFFAAPVSAAAAGDSPHFVLKQIVVNPSGLLAPGELQAVWAPYLGREISLDDLNDIVGGINALYSAKHLITAKAVLPPQTIHAGVVHIQLIEGRIGEITVTGNRDTSTRYITTRIAQKPGDLARPDRLQTAIARFNNTNDVELHAELKPGAAFGTTDIVLLVKEPPPWSVSVVADNTGRGETGIGRISETWTNRSLFGRRDPLTVTGTLSAGTQAGSLSYETPITTGGTRLGLSASSSEVSLIGGDLQGAGVSASAGGYGLSLRHPFAATPSL